MVDGDPGGGYVELPEALGERFEPVSVLAVSPGVERFGVVDANKSPLILELATRATLFDDPLSAFHGAAALCFGPDTPPTPVAAAARALHRLHHPAIPRPKGVGTVDLRPWIVTRRPAGEPVAFHALPWHGAEVLPLAEALFEALSHAHARGVVHRAPTPDNLFWGPGGLGLVGWTSAAVDGHAPPELHVDARFRAPESWLGAEPDPRLDLYAVGVLLYGLLTGRPPFDLGPEIGWQHVHHPPPPLDPGPSPALVTLVKRLLAKDPEHRPANARDALTLLREAPAIARRSVTGPAFARPPGRRRPGLALAALEMGRDESPGLPPLEQTPAPTPQPPADDDEMQPTAELTVPDAFPVPEDPLGAARHLLACGCSADALRRAVDAESAHRLEIEQRNALRVLAGRALLAEGRPIKAFEAFDLAVHAGPGPTLQGLAEIAAAAVDADRIEIAVDAGMRAGRKDRAFGLPLLARLIGRTLLRRAEPPKATQMLPLAVACTHLGFAALEDGEAGGPWFQRGREVGQAGLMALDGPVAPVFPLHLALCAWGTGDTRAARGAVNMALDAGLKAPRSVERIGAEICLRLALLVTHQKARAKTPPDALLEWAAAVDDGS